MQLSSRFQGWPASGIQRTMRCRDRDHRERDRGRDRDRDDKARRQNKNEGELSIQESNAMRAKLGLKPLK